MNKMYPSDVLILLFRWNFEGSAGSPSLTEVTRRQKTFMMNNSISADIQGNLKPFQRVWLFNESVDGIWILTPIAVFGCFINSFLVRFIKLETIR